MDVTKACESFRILLEEQLKRIANINTEKVDFSTKKCVTIGIVDGDGMCWKPCLRMRSPPAA